MTICPVCETQNKPSASHCEVCGERLTPPAPGEEVSPEESMAAQVAELAAARAAAPAPAPATGGFAMDEEDEFDELMGASAAKTGPMAAVAAPSPVTAPPASGGKPDVLYSPRTGAAFARGTAEWEDGFGPMGEELVATLQAVAPEPGPARQPIAVNPGPVRPPAFDTSPAPTPARTPAPVLEHAPEPIHVNPGPMLAPEPIDEPALSLPPPKQAAPAPVLPATITVYQNRQPVLTHQIQTDETLIGRRDVRGDIYPDVDLTAYDQAGEFISRKHVYIYRQNREYTIYVVSNMGTQLGNQILDLGARHSLSDGDVIILGGRLAMKFEVAGDDEI